MSEHTYDDDDHEHDGPDHDDVGFDDVAPEGNRRVGATALQVLEHVTKSIVDDEEGVFIDTEERNGSVTFHVHVAPDDMGRVIGKRGRVAQAIRAVVSAAAHRDGVKSEVEFED